MTINISLTGSDLATAGKDALAGLVDACSAFASESLGTEIELPNTPHGTKSSETVIVPEKVYKDEPIPAKPKPAPQEQAPEPDEGASKTETAGIELIEESAKETDAAMPEEAAPNYTKIREDLKKEAAAIARNGKSKGLKALLEKHGVQKLSELLDTDLETFRAEAEAL